MRSRLGFLAGLWPLAIQPAAMVIGLGLAEYRGFNRGLDVARSIWGPWDVRDPIADMKHDHAGVVAFRSVFS